jgi:hypothetical protein
VLTLSTTPTAPDSGHPSGGIAVELAPPKVHVHMRSEAGRYAGKAKTVTVRHVTNHRIVAMIEIVSPGNKTSRNALNAFVHKAHQALAAGVHLLIVDLFPPGVRDPMGIHQTIWGEDCDADFALPPDKPLACMAYMAGAGPEAFINFLSIGEPLPQMPLFLTADVYVSVPLETTYGLAWESLPKYWQAALGTPRDAAEK